MRILHVTPYFAPAWAYGGPPRSIYELSKELVRQGHEVTVLTTDALDARGRVPSTWKDPDGIEVVRLRNVSNNLAWQQQLFLPLGTTGFLKHRLRSFDVVHLHMVRTWLNVVVHHHALRHQVPFVLSPRGSLPRIVRAKLAKTLFDGFAGHSLVRYASKVIALSKPEKEDCIAAGVPASKVVIVPNGIDPSFYASLPSPGEFAREHGLDGREIVAYLGRLNARKGLGTLIRAFNLLQAERRQPTTLVLAGPDDGYQRHLVELAKSMGLADRVRWLDYLGVEEKLGLLVDADVVVYPAAHESFGLVPFEALLCSTPVVVTEGSGCGELIAGAGAGLTVALGDHESLKECLARVLDSKPETLEMVARGTELVLQDLNWDRIARRMVEVYSSVRVS